MLGVLLLVECATVSGLNVTVLNSQPDTNSLAANDTLVSTPLGHFELGIFEYGDSAYYLCIRYRLPIQQVVTWVANRTTPLSSSARLRFSADGTLNLIDTNNDNFGSGSIWSFPTSTPKVPVHLLTNHVTWKYPEYMYQSINFMYQSLSYVKFHVNY